MSSVVLGAGLVKLPEIDGHLSRRGIGAAGAWLVSASIVVAGLLFTAWAHELLSHVDRERQEATLAGAAEQAVGAILGQFARFETQLTAGQALFAGSDRVTREAWRAFARVFQRDLKQGHSFFEMAWLPEVPAEELPHLVNALAEKGIGKLVLDPPGHREVYCPIVYNEPWEVHADSLGHDACARETTWPAMARAKASGTTSLSLPLGLRTTNGETIPGYVMFAWVESNNGRFSGWVSGTISIDSVFNIAHVGAPRLELAVIDRSNPDPERVVFGNVHDHHRIAQSVTLERHLQLGGRDLLLEFSRPLAPGPAPGLLLATGTVITLLLAGFMHVLLRTRTHAMQLAERMSRAWRASEEMLSSITDNVLEGIYRGTPDEGLVYVNQSLVEMFGFGSAREIMTGAGPTLYASPEQRDELYRQLEEHGQYSNQEVEFVRRDGSRFTAINNCVAVRDEQGRILHFDGVISDITERKRAEQKIHRLAHYDPLTGLPNRALLNDRVLQALRPSKRSGKPLTLMFIDLDRFKTINDSLGHGIGDRLLSAVAERLTARVRDYDTISRLGGDEFVLVLPEVDANMAAAKASAILEAFREPFCVDGHQLTVTPSIGIALHPDDAGDPETLIRNADAAMYHAKEKGRSTFQFFTAELNARAYERLTLENHLRTALDNGELTLVYQPLISLADETIKGAEALLRWNNSVLGEVPPDQFIPVAEQSGLIVEIGDWVIDSACLQLACWGEAGFDQLSVAVNVSAVQFWRGSLGRTVRRALERWEIEPRRLELELTESVVMQDAESARKVLADLKQLGVSLVIDDFGTGYSSLSYLKQFQIDLLKIDRSFVRDLAKNPEDAAIVSAILSMAYDLRIGVVAEGVETSSQLEFLHSRGCQFAQGFLFNRPLSPDRLLERVQGYSPH
jgi:diguanylate cyclase (GGDEF)-like protein/PAS domain S-box-containing protein